MNAREARDYDLADFDWQEWDCRCSYCADDPDPDEPLCRPVEPLRVPLLELFKTAPPPTRRDYGGRR